MLSSLPTFILLAATVANALPLNSRQIKIDAAATAEAQRRDTTATRAFSNVTIQDASGNCLAPNLNSGNSRRNQMQIVSEKCSGSANQQWDFITAGAHNNVAGTTLIVSSSLSNCATFDPRKGKVTLFSCGGRADGGGRVTNSQLFPFPNAKATSLSLAPQSGKGNVCFAVTNGVVVPASCTNPTVFKIGGAVAAPQPPASSATATKTTATAATTTGLASSLVTPTGNVKLDLDATAEAQRRDNGATRAFSNVPIKDASGNCLTVDVNSGDFRRNLMHVISTPCTGDATQQWDFITKGVHNNVTGTALIVSSVFSNCMNFDGRRQPHDRVILFSCGGRGDGSGQINDSQLFPFPDPKATSLSLTPRNENGKTCFAVQSGLLDEASCTNAAIFTIGNAAPGAPAPPPATTAAPTKATTTPVATSSPPAATAPPASAPTGSVKLDLAATAEAQRRDNGATRAFSNVPIKDASGNCLTVDVNSGDFRRNLMHVISKPCTGDATQQFDFITSGVHNNVPGTALIVSSVFNNCANFDDRRQPHDRVIMFSCGGRADGDGKVTDSQLFAFPDPKATSLSLAPRNGKNATCFAVQSGLLDEGSCANAAVFTIGNASPTAPAPASTTTKASSSAAATTTSAPAPPANNNPSVGSVKLDQAATAEAHQRDNTATRAFTAVPIKVGGKCLQANLNTGDFRQNLMIVDVVDCVAGLDVQQWDVITSGKHNNVAGKALIVSSRTNACASFDDRKTPDLKVHLFSCGGRADGSGQVAGSQLFAFTGKSANIPLVPDNVQNSQCLTASAGKLSIAACNPAAPNAAQTFTVG